MRSWSKRQIAWRLFLTCWLVYSVHVATNMVRENYLALAIADHLSFRVNDYAGMHDDMFEHGDFGWHIGSNPGASMLGALPYALSRPAIDAIVRQVNHRRATARTSERPRYHTSFSTDRQLHEEAWRRGYDIKFGLASVVMQSLCMAVICALGVVVLYLLLDSWLDHRRAALWLALLYAFGTPAFYRAGFLNHNMMMATAGFFGFAVLWNRWNWQLTVQRRFLLAGVCGGLAVLLDYSGFLFLAGLWLYGITTLGHRHAFARSAFGLHARYALGAIGPLLLLWFYQLKSFGHPFFPPQHWMPPEAYFELGYLGITWPSLEVVRLLAFDYRFGLFVTCPLFLLALVALPANRLGRDRLPRRELIACLAFAAAFFVFFSGVQHTRWQFNTGIRYLAPIFPFLFLASVVTLLRLPRSVALVIGSLSVLYSWALAMSRDVSGGKIELADPDMGRGALDPVITVLTHGLQLPVLTTLSRMEGYGPLSTNLPRPWHVYLVLALVLIVLWRWRSRPGFRDLDRSA